MSWNDFPIWDRNRSIHFQIGLILSLGFSYWVINYEHEINVYDIIETYNERLDYKTTEIKSHSEKIIKEVEPQPKKIDVLKAKFVLTNEKLPELKPIESTEIEPDQKLNSLSTGSENGNGIAKNLTLTPSVAQPSKVFNITESMPFLTTCKSESDEERKRKCTQEAMLSFIYKNLKYPVIARENRVEGTVIISFVINTKGDLTDVEIKRDIGAGCGKEASKVISMIDDWMPGKHNDLAVNVRYTIPIKFKLQ